MMTIYLLLLMHSDDIIITKISDNFIITYNIYISVSVLLLLDLTDCA